MVQGAWNETGMALVNMMINKKKKTSESLGRRGFLSRLWLALGFVALAELFAGGFAFIVSGRKFDADHSPAEMIEAGTIDEFIPGTVTLIRAGNLYLSRLEDGGFLAISRKCTHLGCAVPWIAERKQFECPCHASIFDSTGDVLKSPAPRALDLYSITFMRDKLMIDISRPVKRPGFIAEQLIYPQEQG